MAHLLRAEVSLLRCTLLFLYLTACLCQRDCTGVDCPQLDNCIEEVLDSGACCTSCLQKGCTCEGYQYYDCINAGFKNGKVPEGNYYFVDYGSTECSCPTGGGRISCHFISCPDIPPNCIDVLEPADGCMQCERVGCVHGGQKYEAGHSFHIDPCKVCHCPNEGGKLICYSVPDCDPKEVHKPMFTASTEEETVSRHASSPYMFNQQGNVDQLSATHHLPPNGNLPLFKSPPLDKEEREDYDYGPTDFPETHPQSLFFPTQSSTTNKVPSVSRGLEESQWNSDFQSFDRGGKLELIEHYRVHEYHEDKEDVTENRLKKEQSTVRPPTDEETTTSWQHPQGLTSVSANDHSPQTDSENSLHAHRSVSSATFPLNQDLRGEKWPKTPHWVSESAVHKPVTKAYYRNVSNNVINSQTNVSHHTRGAEIQNSNGPKELEGTLLPDSEQRVNADDIEGRKQEGRSFTEPKGIDVPYKITQLDRSNESKSSEKTTFEPSTTSAMGPEDHATPTARFIPTTTTTQLPVRVELGESQPSQKPSQRPFKVHSKDREEASEETNQREKEREDRLGSLIRPEGGVSTEGPLLSCCTAGQRWATENHHCNRMLLPDSDSPSACSVAQKQCCLSLVKDSRCESGMTAARRGDTCEVDEKDQCSTDDSQQVCCSCCALGLWARSEGQGCDAHQHLGYPCGHVFLTCCEEEENPGLILLKRKQKPKPTALPRKVSDSKFPKEAFSISTTDEAANALEEQEDVDECQLYAGQLCQHKCTNIWGSYHCECHQGYTLQQDKHSCAPVSPDEDNRLREDSPPMIPTTMTTATSTTTTSPLRLSPCAENGPCSQRCTVVAGRVRCSCFPGFLLLTDGHMCEDVDECATNTHSCRPSERCVNTVGSFVCELQIACPAGHQLRNGVCKDIDECVLRTHNCATGFVCENTVGSFLCKPKHKCIGGFTRDAHGNCIDVNECSSLSEPCSSGFHCINTVGSYTCQQKIIMCSHGYQASPDGAKCVDTDECQMGTHRCAVGQICHNLPGSYRCDCQTGYQYDALRKVCTDVNECWRYPGRLCAQTCENTPGSYHCSCTAGFSLAFDGKNCEDVNECDKSPCSQECANIYGSYQCYCRQGYYLKEDGHTCEDIDECSQRIGNLCAFQCVNVAGSYQCACPPHGYVMAANGRTCRDIDECTAGTHNCSSGQTCYNLQGGFRCLSFNCPHNYKKVSDTRCERISCPANSLACQNSPVRITFYQLSFQTNIIIPAQIFRIGPSPAYSGDHIVISITKGNEEGYFSTRKLNSFTGAVYLQRKVHEPKDFLIDVEMKLLRQGTHTSFLARIYVFITTSTM